MSRDAIYRTSCRYREFFAEDIGCRIPSIFLDIHQECLIKLLADGTKKCGGIDEIEFVRLPDMGPSEFACAEASEYGGNR